MTPQLTSNYNKGFSMTFENGLTISVQYGCGNYCANRFRPGVTSITDHMKHTRTESTDAEIAIWDANNFDFDFGSDSVLGWVSPNDVANWIYLTAKAEDIHDLLTLAVEFGQMEHPINQKQ